MAELADALGSGLSACKGMGVQVPLRPPKKNGVKVFYIYSTINFIFEEV